MKSKMILEHCIGTMKLDAFQFLLVYFQNLTGISSVDLDSKDLVLLLRMHYSLSRIEVFFNLKYLLLRANIRI